MPTSTNLSRRRFIGVAAGTGVGVVSAAHLGAMGSPAFAAMGVAGPDTPHGHIGIQLFSIRNLVSSLGFRVVFEELARIGYTEIEFAGYNQSTDILGRQITVPEIKQLLDDNGLRAIGSHIGRTTLLGIPGNNQTPAEAVAAQTLAFDNAEILGMPYIGTANDISGSTVAEVQEGAEQFNAAGAVAAARGLKIYQHNHTNEFRPTSDDPTRRRWDVFLATTDPSLVFLEMDIYWAYQGAWQYPGFDPTDYVAPQPQRFPLFHVKDGDQREDGSYAITEFGMGDIPFRHFFDHVGARAVNHPIWEQDNAPSTPAASGGAMGAAERSYNNMHAVRTLTWLDEAAQLLHRLHDEGRLARHVHDSLLDRLQRATAFAEMGSEVRAMGLVQQFLARADNQIKGDADDALVRALVVTIGDTLMTWLHEAEDRESVL